LSLASALTVSLDAVVALWLLGPEQAAQMALVQRAGMTVIGHLMVSTQSLWPAFTEAVAKGERDWVVKHARGAVALVASLSLAGGVVLVFAGPVLVRAWLGPALPLDRTILAALACWVFVLSIGRIPDLLLNSLGKAWIQVHVSLVFSVVAFGLKLILAPALGVAGIVYATAIAYALTHVPAYLWWMRRWTAPPEGSANVVAA
jgi:O-antigen/teichoic acid export membrane protein